MKTAQSSVLALSVLLLAFAFAYANADAYERPVQPPPRPYTPPKVTADVVVEGVVYCQSCETSGSWSLSEAEPISGATVSVICRDYRRRISYYKPFTTDDEGYFYAQLDGFKMRHPLLDHPLQSCVVKLVSSPDEKCNEFTNVNYGINGARLRFEMKRILNKNYDAVIYAAGPLAFRPDHCAPDEY